jgi:cobalamin biosynthesis protein CobT
MVRESRRQKSLKGEAGDEGSLEELPSRGGARSEGDTEPADQAGGEEEEEAEAEDSDADEDDDEDGDEGDESSDDSVIEPEPLPERDALPERTTRGLRMGQVLVLLMQVLTGRLFTGSEWGLSCRWPTCL